MFWCSQDCLGFFLLRSHKRQCSGSTSKITETPFSLKCGSPFFDDAFGNSYIRVSQWSAFNAYMENYNSERVVAIRCYCYLCIKLLNALQRWKTAPVAHSFTRIAWSPSSYFHENWKMRVWARLAFFWSYIEFKSSSALTLTNERMDTFAWYRILSTHFSILLLEITLLNVQNKLMIVFSISLFCIQTFIFVVRSTDYSVHD